MTVYMKRTSCRNPHSTLLSEGANHTIRDSGRDAEILYTLDIRIFKHRILYVE